MLRKSRVESFLPAESKITESFYLMYKVLAQEYEREERWIRKSHGGEKK